MACTVALDGFIRKLSEDKLVFLGNLDEAIVLNSLCSIFIANLCISYRKTFSSAVLPFMFYLLQSTLCFYFHIYFNVIILKQSIKFLTL